MSVVEEMLARAGGNIHQAATLLVMGLMRGDPDTFKLGYSFGSALIAAAEMYELDRNAMGLVAQLVTEQLGDHHSGSKHPLVVIGVGGGLVQWTYEKPGIGTPDVYTLDFDREGNTDEELIDFLAEIDAVLEVLVTYGPALNDYDRDVRYTLGLARNQYQDHIDEGTKPSRFR